LSSPIQIQHFEINDDILTCGARIVTMNDSTNTNHADKLDHIREIAMTTSEPRNADEIAEMAGVARNTAENISINSLKQIRSLSRNEAAKRATTRTR
jgi:phage anti-repressor protein